MNVLELLGDFGRAYRDRTCNPQIRKLYDLLEFPNHFKPNPENCTQNSTLAFFLKRSECPVVADENPAFSNCVSGILEVHAGQAPNPLHVRLGCFPSADAQVRVAPHRRNSLRELFDFLAAFLPARIFFVHYRPSQPMVIFATWPHIGQLAIFLFKNVPRYTPHRD